MLLLVKLSCLLVSDSTFLLDSFSKAKIFPNVSAVNSFLFRNRFSNPKVYDKCGFIVTVFLRKTIQCSYFLFSVYQVKLSVS